MTQQTSIDAYHELQPGKIGKMQKQVLECFMKHGACTNLEISDWYNLPINRVTPRTNELVKKGLIVKSHKRICSISKKVVIAWKVSNLADNNTNTQEP